MNTIIMMFLLKGTSASLNDLAGVPDVALTGVLVTTPSWLLFCLLLLPAVTRRAAHGRPLPRATFFGISALLGSLLLIPIGIMFFGSITWIGWEFALFGAIGGLSIALAWQVLVLKSAAEPDNRYLQGSYRA